MAYFCIKIKGKLLYIDLVKELHVILPRVNELLGGKFHKCVRISVIL